VSAINATSLADGTVPVSATVTDVAGNVSSAKTGTTTKDTVVTGALRTTGNKIHLTDSTGAAADTIFGDSTAISSFGSDSGLALLAKETAGPNLGKEFTGAQVLSSGDGSFPAFNVEAVSSGAVGYDLYLTDTAGNRTGILLNVTRTSSH
jgi:hypothetical protein